MHVMDGEPRYRERFLTQAGTRVNHQWPAVSGRRSLIDVILSLPARRHPNPRRNRIEADRSSRGMHLSTNVTGGRP